MNATDALKTIKQKTKADRQTYHVTRGLDFLGSVSRDRHMGTGVWSAWKAMTPVGLVAGIASFEDAVAIVDGRDA